MSDIHNCGHLSSVYYVPRTVLKSIFQMPFYVIFIETLSDNAYHLHDAGEETVLGWMGYPNV